LLGCIDFETLISKENYFGVPNHFIFKKFNNVTLFHFLEFFDHEHMFETCLGICFRKYFFKILLEVFYVFN
jgi:hypothetical protein